MRNSRRSGFTLVELLVVIGIIAVLIAMLLPALAKVRKQVEMTACASNLRQVGIACYAYAGDNKGLLPPCPPTANYPFYTNLDPNPVWGLNPLAKGHVYLLPYIGGKGIYSGVAQTNNAKIFFCPSSRYEYDPNWATTGGGYLTTSFVQYCGWRFLGLNVAGWYLNSPSKLRERSSRLLYMDIACIPGLASDPNASRFNHRDKYGQPIGANCLYLDGHVQFVARKQLTVKTGLLPPGTFYFPDTK